MKKTLSKILVSLCMLGVFLLPLFGQIQIQNSELAIKLEIKKVKAQQEQWWFAHSVPGNSSATLNVGPFNSLAECQTGEAQVLDTFNNLPDSPDITITEPCHSTTTTPEGNVAVLGNAQKTGLEFECNILNPFSLFSECIAWFLYHVIFVPLAWITGGAADILDYFIYYSTSHQAYTNTFIEKGWGTVRDIANVLFIIGLLFVAIKTILGLNTTNNKKMIGNIVIFALLINFSLFATQVIVDSSNILAKIFYNQITPVDKNGVPIDDKNAQRSVTVGLVKTFNPQDVISADTNIYGEKKVGDKTAQIMLITILAIALMCFMIYIFISVAFLFVARTVSIWMAMILAPIAFASNAIDPHIKGLGWSEWLSNLLKNAFMAPIFIFFLYIIILFGDLFSLAGASVNGGEDKNIVAFMGTFIPFMLVFVLLRQAKNLAVIYSGEMGKAISTGAVAVGGLALGGAALGTAFAGRQIAGRSMAAMSRRDGATDYAKKKMEFSDKVKEGSFTGTWKDYKKQEGLKYGVRDTIGGRVNYSQKKSGQINHARHDMDDLKKKAGLEGKDNFQLTNTDIETLEKKFKTEKRSEIESQINRGDKGMYLVGDKKAYSGASEFKKGEREEVIAGLARTDTNFKKDSTGKLTNELTEEAARKVSLEVDVKYNEALKKSFESVSTEKFTHLKEESTEKIGAGSSIMAKSAGGSYDIRDVTKLKADKREGLGTKATVALITAIAAAVRLGVKKGAGMEPGKSDGDFRKDLASLIKDSLNVKIDLGGESGGGHAKPSGGGGHGGGGGHH